MKKSYQYTKGKLVQIILAAVLVTAVLLSGAAWLLLGESGRTLVAADWYVKNRFVGAYDETEWLDSVMTAMVTGLGDRWSYYSDEEYYEYQQATKDGSYVGIGITLDYTDDAGLRITNVAQGGPADLAGVIVGEYVTAVYGEAVTAENKREITSAVSGAVGGEVTLEVESAAGVRRQVTMLRAKIEGKPVIGALEGDIGVVTYTNFYWQSSKKFMEELDILLEAGAKGLVIDVRGNPGGYLADLLVVLDYLLPEGPTFQSVDYRGRSTVYSSTEEHSVELPIVVLVDGESYSAAEFCAAQLRESVGAVLVGQPTTGKGYSQQPFRLPNGGALNLSSAEYRTGGGVSLAATGLTPDYVVENVGNSDLQLEKAMEIIEELVAKRY